MTRLTFTLVALLSLVILFQTPAKLTSERNNNATASRAFKFKTVPPPVKDDVAAGAKLSILDGEIDPNGADVTALTDGLLPTEEDQPAANFFFQAGTGGGRIRMDLGKMIDIAEINTYSWHPNTRGPQVYKLWASEGSEAKFNAEPKGNIDPATCGWKLLTTVDTRSSDGSDGGQYGVSITNPGASLGKYRYLIFDCYVTETADDWGNTFYSEIDVLAKK